MRLFCLSVCRTCEILDRGGIVSEGGGRDLEGGAVAPPARRRRAVERPDDAGRVEHARQQDPFFYAAFTEKKAKE